MGNKRYSRKHQFKGNKFCKIVSVFNNEKISINSSIPTASESKLINSLKPADVPENNVYHLKEHLVSWKKKLEFAASNVAWNAMKEAALKIRSSKTDTEFSQCGVSVDGTWNEDDIPP
ncbi:hypothetical protein TNCV_2835541 [Trichonephila clavipes]|uniref:Uncharacterized protein n=1 Tax=Trichonephila clavipes TaxID=2585209 RepID=A0A8X6RR28_TRICX|nr:hypothetical protein TNCV_2835541 [Trichonephila clavipes]